MKYCKNCGASIPDESVFCENCGAVCEADNGGTPQPVFTPAEEVSAESQPNCLITAIIGLALSCWPVTSIAGIIVSAIALKKIKGINGKLTVKNKVAKILAIVGLVSSIFCTVAYGISFLAGIVAGLSGVADQVANSIY